MKTRSNKSFAIALSSFPGAAGYAAARQKAKASTFKQHQGRSVVALLVVALLGFSNIAVIAHPRPHPPPAPAQEAQDAPKIPNDQLDSLVAPIALYPDPLLSQTLCEDFYRQLRRHRVPEGPWARLPEYRQEDGVIQPGRDLASHRRRMVNLSDRFTWYMCVVI